MNVCYVMLMFGLHYSRVLNTAPYWRNKLCSERYVHPKILKISSSTTPGRTDGMPR